MAICYVKIKGLFGDQFLKVMCGCQKYKAQKSKHKRLQTIETDYRLQITDYRLQTTDYRLQTTDYRLQTTDYRLLKQTIETRLLKHDY